MYILDYRHHKSRRYDLKLLHCIRGVPNIVVTGHSQTGFSQKRAKTIVSQYSKQMVVELQVAMSTY